MKRNKGMAQQLMVATGDTAKSQDGNAIKPHFVKTSEMPAKPKTMQNTINVQSEMQLRADTPEIYGAENSDHYSANLPSKR